MDNYTLLNNRILLCGKTKSGKSRLLKYLVKSELKNFSKIIVVCPTEKINRFYADVVDEEFIFDEYNEEYFEELIKKMTEVNANKSDKEKRHILVIIDDCVSDTNFHYSKSLKKLYSRGRHLGISIILTSQYINLCPPFSRVNSDFIFVAQMNRASQDILCNEFICGEISKEEFLKIYRNSTKDYGFLVINNNSVKDNCDINSLYGSIKTPSKYLN
jgi:hypothetical protein